MTADPDHRSPSSAPSRRRLRSRLHGTAIAVVAAGDLALCLWIDRLI